LKYVVTGGNGFLGREICCYLATQGHEVISVDLVKPELNLNFEFRQCDVSDQNAMKHVMRGAERVIHTAAVVPMRKAGKKYLLVNAEGTRSAIAASIDAGATHFTYVSSSAVYGIDGEDGGLSIPSVEPRPAEAYGYSKLEGEKICRAHKSEIQVAIIRPRTILGPGRIGIFSILFDRVRRSKDIYVLGDGTQLLQLISLDDVVRLTSICSHFEKTGIFNLGGPNPLSMRQTLEALCVFANSKSQVRSLPALPVKLALASLDKLNLSPFAPWHYKTLDRSMSLNISQTNEQLGLCNSSSLQALKDSYSWYFSNASSAAKSDDAYSHRESAKSGIFKFF